MNKYIVINSEDIQKRIEELKESDILKQWKKDTETHNGHSPQQSRQKAIIEVEINQKIKNAQLIAKEIYNL